MPLTQNTKNYIQMIELASRSLNIGDAFQMLYANNGALLFTLNAGIFGEGTQISLCDFDGGLPLFAAGAGVTIESAGALGPTLQFTVATIIRVPEDLASETWVCVGNVL